MELPLIMGKLAHLLAELNLKSFFHDKDVIQFYLKPPFPWASSPSQTEKVSVLSSLWGKVFFVGYSGEKKKKKTDGHRTAEGRPPVQRFERRVR